MDILQSKPGDRTDCQSLKGKVVVLEFWATWCGPCVAAIPHLNELSAKFPPSQVQFIAITDEERAAVEPFLKKRPIDAWIGLERKTAIYKDYGRPTTVLIDKFGKVAAVIRPTDLQESLLQALVEGKPVETKSLALAADTPSFLPDRENPAVKPMFKMEIRPTLYPESRGISYKTGMLRLYNYSLSSLFGWCFNTTAVRVNLDARLPKEFYDVIFDMPGAGKQEQETALAESLKLACHAKTHWEEKEVEAYVLGSTPLAASALPAKGPCGTAAMSDQNHLTMINNSMPELATFLEALLDAPVVDETNLKEKYDVQIQLTAEKGVAKYQPGLEKLGLTLRSAKRKINMLVVDTTSPWSAFMSLSTSLLASWPWKSGALS
jgi:uncharacterized protein (TIGR03435 family)